jgi:dUTP pyrophosphatase
MTVIGMKKVSDLAQPLRCAYGTSAGIDIAAVRIAKEYDGVYLLGTGWSLEIPDTHYVEIHERSSTHKEGWTLANNVGIIDPCYRGEIFLAMTPTIASTKMGKEGRDLPQLPWYAAQLIVKKREIALWSEVDELSVTERGDGGFGSSNISLVEELVNKVLDQQE